MPPRRGGRTTAAQRAAEREPTPPPVPDPVPEVVAYPGIDFGPNQEALTLHLVHMTAKKRIQRSVTAPSQFLNDIEILDDVRNLLSFGGLDFLIDSAIPTNERLVYEFLASFVHYPTSGTVTDVSFRLGNQAWSFTHAELAAILGFPADGIYPVYDELDRHEAWLEIGTQGSVFYPTVPASMIRGGAVKYVHRLISYTVFDRYERGTKVTAEEMDYLVSLIREQRVDTTSVLCHRFAEWAAEGTRHKVFGGGLFIWKIAAHLGVAPDESLPPLPLDRKELEIGIILERGQHCAWLTRSRPEPRAAKLVPDILLRVEKLRRERAGAEADDVFQPDIPAHAPVTSAAMGPYPHYPASGPSPQPTPSDFGERLTAIEATQRAILASQRTLEAYIRHSDAQYRVDRAHQRAMNRWIADTMMYVQDDTAWAPPPPSPDYPGPFQWPGSSSAPSGPDDHSTA